MCTFCDIVNHKRTARIISEDNDVVVFHDIHPQAPTHVLVIPRKHIESLTTTSEQDALLLGKILLRAAQVAEQMAIAAPGYRVVINAGRAGGQTVFHLHAHVLGGRAMAWPPG